MSQSQNKSREFVTKEIFIALTPLLASYAWIIFFEAGYSNYFKIPHELISLSITDVFLANRSSLIAAVVGFLWIGLYYNLMPSLASVWFKVFITVSLVLSIAFGSFYGDYSARAQVDFYVLNSTPSELVLRIYGDMMVTANFDRQTRTLEQNFHIRRLGDDPNLILQFESLGPVFPRKK